MLRFQDTTSQIRVRGALLLLIVLTVAAINLKLDGILGALLAGAMLSTIDRDRDADFGNFRLKLDAIGYGVIVPVFFISSGIGFDGKLLFSSPTALARVPMFLALLLVVRGVPILLLDRDLGRRLAFAAALLESTSLSFIVVATTLGLELGQITRVNATALVAAGMMSALVFPALAGAYLRADRAAAATGAQVIGPEAAGTRSRP
jgi:Kef-type K+ transport system membrane component KefB